MFSVFRTIYAPYSICRDIKSYFYASAITVKSSQNFKYCSVTCLLVLQCGQYLSVLGTHYSTLVTTKITRHCVAILLYGCTLGKLVKTYGLVMLTRLPKVAITGTSTEAT